jgi:2-iminobutanoate/2-iminopropanoate deaminase
MRAMLLDCGYWKNRHRRIHVELVKLARFQFTPKSLSRHDSLSGWLHFQVGRTFRLFNEASLYSIAAMRHITPKTIRPPFARYSYGVEIPPGHRILFCSGQLGIDPAERVPATVEEQTRLCFHNIAAVLKEADLGFADVVRINAFVTGREHLQGYMAARDQFISDPPPASTLMIVSGFARPEFLVEVEVLAAGHAQ